LNLSQFQSEKPVFDPPKDGPIVNQKSAFLVLTAFRTWNMKHGGTKTGFSNSEKGPKVYQKSAFGLFLDHVSKM
jgi:hypothetical protein